jgi:hypothetical protein
MDQIKAFWKTAIGKIVIIAGSFVFMCFCCLVFSALLPTPPQTPQSMTSTAEAQVAQLITQTAAAAPTATETLPPPPTATDTPAPTIAPEILTQQAQGSTATALASYVAMDPRVLLTYPNNHIGETIVVTGTIFNINSDTELQIWVGNNNDAVYVLMAEPFTGIYEDDTIKVYGLIAGENCGENAFGGEVCQPLLIDAFFEKP